jgi:hypothetical protein
MRAASISGFFEKTQELYWQAHKKYQHDIVVHTACVLLAYNAFQNLYAANK